MIKSEEGKWCNLDRGRLHESKTEKMTEKSCNELNFTYKSRVVVRVQSLHDESRANAEKRIWNRRTHLSSVSSGTQTPFPHWTLDRQSMQRLPSADSPALPSWCSRTGRRCCCQWRETAGQQASQSCRKWFPTPSWRKRLLLPSCKWHKSSQQSFRRQMSCGSWADSRSSTTSIR